MLKKEKGSVIITAPIITIAMFFIISITIVIAIEVIKPFIIYEKISSVALKYIFIMEEYGYLNNIEKNNLINELDKKGIEINKLNISGDMDKRAYGETIELKIEYNYASNLLGISNVFSVNNSEKVIPIIIEKKSFSKI